MLPGRRRVADSAVTVAAKIESVSYPHERRDCAPETTDELPAFAWDADGVSVALILDSQANALYDLSLRLFSDRWHCAPKALFMATFVPTQRDVERSWYVIDANSQVLGRIATVAAQLLQGKHKPRYTPFLDLGDHVVIINAERVKLTGRKERQKLYRQHSGYMGGLREERAAIVRRRQPTRMVERAVRGMLPKTKLGNAMYRKLKVYAGSIHPHTAQKPTTYEVN